MRPPDVTEVVLCRFWPILYCACAQSAILQRPMKIMTSLLIQ